jgi:hypothetical protein
METIQDSEGNEEMDTQFWTPTEQRKMMPRNPMIFARTFSKKKSCK